MTNPRKSYGFTLIEVIVAVGVIAVGFVGSLILLSNVVSNAKIVKDRVVAMHLAAEGIEVIANIRDTNFLNDRNWRTGLGDTVVGLVDYNSSVMSENTNSASWCLNWDGSFYKHLVSLPYNCNTFFKRHVELRTLSESITVGGNTSSVDFLEVRSVVEWQEKNQSKSITVTDHLYDWK